MACQCYGRLPCLGGLLDRGVGAGRAEGWTSQIHCLLASANGQLAQIYQGSETGMLFHQKTSGVEFSDSFVYLYVYLIYAACFTVFIDLL